MMAVENNYTEKFKRKYFGYNPEKRFGPTTQILDTVVKPIIPKPTP